MDENGSVLCVEEACGGEKDGDSEPLVLVSRNIPPVPEWLVTARQRYQTTLRPILQGWNGAELFVLAGSPKIGSASCRERV